MHTCEGDGHGEEQARKEWQSLKLHLETGECPMVKLHELELFS